VAQILERELLHIEQTNGLITTIESKKAKSANRTELTLLTDSLLKLNFTQQVVAFSAFLRSSQHAPSALCLLHGDTKFETLKWAVYCLGSELELSKSTRLSIYPLDITSQGGDNPLELVYYQLVKILPMRTAFDPSKMGAEISSALHKKLSEESIHIIFCFTGTVSLLFGDAKYLREFRNNFWTPTSERLKNCQKTKKNKSRITMFFLHDGKNKGHFSKVMQDEDYCFAIALPEIGKLQYSDVTKWIKDYWEDVSCYCDTTSDTLDEIIKEIEDFHSSELDPKESLDFLAIRFQHTWSELLVFLNTIHNTENEN
jgi:hypothetical protein